MSHRSQMLYFSGICALAAASATQCSRPSAIVLECVAPDIRHVLRVAENGRTVEDLSAVPAKLGDADVSPSEYRFRFEEHRDRYELMFRVDRKTGRGTRELFDDEQQLIHGHGGFDEISCAPYQGRL